MPIHKIAVVACFTLLLALSGCSRQQSDWEKTRAANTTDAYELFLKKYPSGEFTAQAQARVKELYEERDWQKARDTDTAEAYQAFLKQYPEGKWTEEARIRVENFTLAQVPAPAAGDGSTPPNAPEGAEPPPQPPVPTPRASAPAPAAKPPVAMKAAAKNETGTFGIQLGAFKSSADAANKRWSELAKAYPAQLSGLSPKVSVTKASTGTLYRLQVLHLTESHARSICKSLQTSSQACVVVHPAQ